MATAEAMATAATMLPDLSGPQPQRDGFPPTSDSEKTNNVRAPPSNGLEQYIGQGEDDAPRSPMRKPHKKSSSVRINGHSRDKEDTTSQLMVERFQDKDGEHLTTVKQYRSHGKAETQVRRSDELVSGRRVGTKWERSQYVHVDFL